MRQRLESAENRPLGDSPIVRTGVRLLVPFIQLFGLYIIVHGHYVITSYSIHYTKLYEPQIGQQPVVERRNQHPGGGKLSQQFDNGRSGPIILDFQIQA